jgi:hypothetical protein
MKYLLSTLISISVFAFLATAPPALARTEVNRIGPVEPGYTGITIWLISFATVHCHAGLSPLTCQGVRLVIRYFPGGSASISTGLVNK